MTKRILSLILAISMAADPAVSEISCLVSSGASSRRQMGSCAALDSALAYQAFSLPALAPLRRITAYFNEPITQPRTGPSFGGLLTGWRRKPAAPSIQPASIENTFDARLSYDIYIKALERIIIVTGFPLLSAAVLLISACEDAFAATVLAFLVVIVPLIEFARRAALFDREHLAGRISADTRRGVLFSTVWQYPGTFGSLDSFLTDFTEKLDSPELLEGGARIYFQQMYRQLGYSNFISRLFAAFQARLWMRHNRKLQQENISLLEALQERLKTLMADITEHISKQSHRLIGIPALQALLTGLKMRLLRERNPTASRISLESEASREISKIMPAVEEYIFRVAVFLTVAVTLTVGGITGGFLHIDDYLLVQIPATLLAAALVQAFFFAVAHADRTILRGVGVRFVAALYLQWLWLSGRGGDAIQIHRINNRLWPRKFGEPLHTSHISRDTEGFLAGYQFIRDYLGLYLWGPEPGPKPTPDEKPSLEKRLEQVREDIVRKAQKKGLGLLSLSWHGVDRDGNITDAPITTMLAAWGPSGYVAISQAVEDLNRPIPADLRQEFKIVAYGNFLKVIFQPSKSPSLSDDEIVSVFEALGNAVVENVYTKDPTDASHAKDDNVTGEKQNPNLKKITSVEIDPFAVTLKLALISGIIYSIGNVVMILIFVSSHGRYAVLTDSVNLTLWTLSVGLAYLIAGPPPSSRFEQQRRDWSWSAWEEIFFRLMVPLGLLAWGGYSGEPITQRFGTPLEIVSIIAGTSFIQALVFAISHLLASHRIKGFLTRFEAAILLEWLVVTGRWKTAVAAHRYNNVKANEWVITTVRQDELKKALDVLLPAERKWLDRLIQRRIPWSVRQPGTRPAIAEDDAWDDDATGWDRKDLASEIEKARKQWQAAAGENENGIDFTIRAFVAGEREDTGIQGHVATMVVGWKPANTFNPTKLANFMREQPEMRHILPRLRFQPVDDNSGLIITVMDELTGREMTALNISESNDHIESINGVLPRAPLDPGETVAVLNSLQAAFTQALPEAAPDANHWTPALLRKLAVQVENGELNPTPEAVTSDRQRKCPGGRDIYWLAQLLEGDMEGISVGQFLSNALWEIQIQGQTEAPDSMARLKKLSSLTHKQIEILIARIQPSQPDMSPEFTESLIGRPGWENLSRLATELNGLNSNLSVGEFLQRASRRRTTIVKAEVPTKIPQASASRKRKSATSGGKTGSTAWGNESFQALDLETQHVVCGGNVKELQRRLGKSDTFVDHVLYEMIASHGEPDDEYRMRIEQRIQLRRLLILAYAAALGNEKEAIAVARLKDPNVTESDFHDLWIADDPTVKLLVDDAKEHAQLQGEPLSDDDFGKQRIEILTATVCHANNWNTTLITPALNRRLNRPPKKGISAEQVKEWFRDDKLLTAIDGFAGERGIILPVRRKSSEIKMLTAASHPTPCPFANPKVVLDRVIAEGYCLGKLHRTLQQPVWVCAMVGMLPNSSIFRELLKLLSWWQHKGGKPQGTWKNYVDYLLNQNDKAASAESPGKISGGNGASALKSVLPFVLLPAAGALGWLAHSHLGVSSGGFEAAGMFSLGNPLAWLVESVLGVIFLLVVRDSNPFVLQSSRAPLRSEDAPDLMIGAARDDPQLFLHAGSPAYDRRVEALIKEGIPALITKLDPEKEPDPFTRAATADAIGIIIYGMDGRFITSSDYKPTRRALKAALKDPYADVRAAAAAALGNLPDLETIRVLINALPDRSVSVDVIRSLARIGEPARPALLEALGRKEPGVRAGAVAALGLPGEDAAIQSVLKLINDPSSIVRRAVVNVLGMVKNPEYNIAGSIAPLTAALDDADSRVRAGAVRALGDLSGIADVMGDPALFKDAVTRLASDLTENKERLAPRTDVTDALRKIAAAIPESGRASSGLYSDAVISPLVKLLGHSDGVLQKIAEEILVLIGAPAIGTLAEALEGRENLRQTAAAARILGSIASSISEKWRVDPLFHEVIVTLTAAMGREQEPSMKIVFAEAIGEIAAQIPEAEKSWLSEKIVPALIAAPAGHNSSMRTAAGTALIGIGAPAIGALTRELRDRKRDNPVAAAAAARNLGRIVSSARDEDAIDSLFGASIRELIAVLKDPDSPVALREEAAEAIGNISAQIPETIRPREIWLSREAVPALAAIAFQDGPKKPRLAAENALTRIGVTAIGELTRTLEGRENLRQAAAAARILGGTASSVEDKTRIGLVYEAPVVALVAALRDKNKDLRKDSAEAIGRIAEQIPEHDRPGSAWLSREAVPALVAALADNNSDVRASAEEALLRTGATAIPILHETLLRLDNPNLRAAAAVILGKLNTPQAIRTLIQVLGSEPDRAVRTAIAEALILAGPEAIPGLLELAGNNYENWIRCPEAVTALGRLGNSEVIRVIGMVFTAVPKPAKEIRRLAARLIASFGTANIISILEMAFQDPDREVRRSAVDGAGQFTEDPRCFGILKQAYDDPDDTLVALKTSHVPSFMQRLRLERAA